MGKGFVGNKDDKSRRDDSDTSPQPYDLSSERCFRFFDRHD